MKMKMACHAVSCAIDFNLSKGRHRITRSLGIQTSIDDTEAAWDNPTMIVTLDAKRRVSIPVGLAPAKPGDQFEARYDEDDDVITLRPVPRKKDWLEVLKQCPVSMDDLPPRSRELPKK